jgi:hypothetical protein
MRYKHHVIPLHEWRRRINAKATRYNEDFNATDNVVWLTLEQHAQSHQLLYELNGSGYDEMAYLGLSNKIGKEEIHQRIVSIANMGNQNALGHTCTDEWKREQSVRGIGNKNALGSKRSHEHKEAARIRMTGVKRGPYRYYVRKSRGPYRKRVVL